jgi:hypothetical protein
VAPVWQWDIEKEGELSAKNPPGEAEKPSALAPLLYLTLLTNHKINNKLLNI